MGKPTAKIARRGAQLLRAAPFILPALLTYAVFVLYPFGSSIFLSLTSWNGVSASKPFVGLANYIEMLHDERVWGAFYHTLIWVLVATVVPIIIGLVLALLLWSGARFALALRTIYFVPFVLPIVVVGVVWGWIYHPLFGPLNRALEMIGLDSVARGWLGDPSTALAAVLVTGIWSYFGFVTVVLLAGLQSMDMDLIDAALIDGANWFQQARYVIVPQLAPVLTFVTVVTLIGGFAVFDIVFVMTGGGPGTSTEVLATYTLTVFNQTRVGYSLALSMVMTVLSLAAAVAIVWLRDRRFRYA